MKREWVVAVMIIAVFVIAFGGIGLVGQAVKNSPEETVINSEGVKIILQRGDLDIDGDVDEDDVDFLINYLFKGGAPPNPLKLANIDGQDPIDMADLTYLISYVYPSNAAPMSLMRGDCNNDRIVNSEDIDCLTNYLFIGLDGLDPFEAGNVDGDSQGVVDIADLTYLISYVHPQGPQPVPMPTGDLNKDGIIDEEDVSFLTNYLYIDFDAAPEPLELADVNGDGGVSIADLMVLTEYTLGSGDPLVPMPTGDLNKDGVIDEADVDFMVNYLFVTFEPAPEPLELADVNGVGAIGDIADLDYLISHVFPQKPSLEVVERGDLDHDGIIDGDDLDYLVAYLFEEGPAPVPLEIANMDGHGLIDIADVTYLIGYLYPSGKAPVPLEIDSTCSDSDLFNNYFLKGEVTSSTPGLNGFCADSCLDGVTLKECTCGDSQEVVESNYQCPAGCSEGACAMLTPGRGDKCAAVVSGGPEIAPRTRVRLQGALKYCDPLTVEYKDMSALDELCVGDYECLSNVCLDGYCTSIKRELQNQESLLTKIWCAIIHPIAVMDRDSADSDNAYLKCISPASKQPEVPLSSCTDSDGGVDFSVKGDIVRYIDGVRFPTNEGDYDSDYCQGTPGMLSEFSCAADYSLIQTDHVCPYGCSNGACLNEPRQQQKDNEAD